MEINADVCTSFGFIRATHVHEASYALYIRGTLDHGDGPRAGRWIIPWGKVISIELTDPLEDGQ